jgi:hypothetical protein
MNKSEELYFILKTISKGYSYITKLADGSDKKEHHTENTPTVYLSALAIREGIQHPFDLIGNLLNDEYIKNSVDDNTLGVTVIITPKGLLWLEEYETKVKNSKTKLISKTTEAIGIFLIIPQFIYYCIEIWHFFHCH